MSTNTIPQMSQPQTTPPPVPGGSNAYSRKFQPSERKSAGQSSRAKLGIPFHTATPT